MRRLWMMVAALVLAGFHCLAASSEWTLYKINGRDHVTMENVSRFYGLGRVQRASNQFMMKSSNGGRSLRGRANSQEFFINGLKIILSYPVVEHDGHLCISRMDLTKIIEPIMRPSKIKGAELVDTIILDPGHGGSENGAASRYGYEKDYTLDVALRARRHLLAAGFKVKMTRQTDETVSLYERARYGSQFDNAVFVSIHFNAGGAGTGLETYTLAPRGVPSMMSDGPRVSDFNDCPGNKRDAENIALATAMHYSLVARSRLYDRGLKRARFVVIRECTNPSVLIEGGFLTNPNEAKIIAMPQYREQMAQSITSALLNYRRAVAGPGQQMATNLRPADQPMRELPPEPAFAPGAATTPPEQPATPEEPRVEIGGGGGGSVEIPIPSGPIPGVPAAPQPNPPVDTPRVDIPAAPPRRTPSP